MTKEPCKTHISEKITYLKKGFTSQKLPSKGNSVLKVVNSQRRPD
jgi:hypothetical protein